VASDNAPETSVVIVNYNGGAYLESCLEAVFAQSVQGGFEVLLVDNASSDGSAELALARFPDLRVLRLARNFGFAGANNAGIRQARGRFVVLLNNDTRVRPGMLAALRAAALSDERAAAVTAKLVYADRPNVIQNAGLLLLTDGGGADRGVGEEDAGQYALREEVFGFCGAAALLKREALADVGGFDDRFFIYYEDLDLSWRFRLRGWRIVFEPAAVVEHAHAATSGEWSEFFTFHVDRNRVLTLLKNAPARMVVRSLLALSRRVAAADGAAHHATAGVHSRVLASLLRLLPHALWQRLRIRTRRRVPDADWQRLLYPRERWDRRGA
jgi:GT2 family glycosyltransferase